MQEENKSIFSNFTRVQKTISHENQLQRAKLAYVRVFKDEEAKPWLSIL